MVSLVTAKVGDVLASDVGWNGIRLIKVDRITDTLVICGEERYRKDSGRISSSDRSAYSTRHARLCTPDDILQYRLQNAQRRIERLKITEKTLDAAEALYVLSREDAA